MLTEFIKPPNQLKISEDELLVSHQRVLTANNPNAPDNLTRFVRSSGPEGKPINEFRIDASVSHVAVHFTQHANYVSLNSEEAKQQQAFLNSDQKHGLDVNSFNFIERGTQTLSYWHPKKSVGTETEVPKKSLFVGHATQWSIFDEYTQDLHKNQPMKNEDEEDEDTEKGTLESQSMKRAARILERMVLQNCYAEISHDYVFYDHAADQFDANQGSLLPLWRFSPLRSMKLKKSMRCITSIVWNPRYTDMFAASFGSYDFMRQGWGMICLFSLKNPQHPHLMINATSGVLCLDFHPKRPSLLCAGMYDGSVAVYDCVSGKLVAKSSALTGKHTEPVWNIQWRRVAVSRSLSFVSLSSDGQIMEWQLGDELKPQLLCRLPQLGPSVSTTNTTEESFNPVDRSLPASLSCMAFDPRNQQLFLVGSEEGHLFKCSLSYSNNYLSSVRAHLISMYSIAFNPFHPKAVLTCGSDWIVKLFDHTTMQSLLEFDLGSAVNDIAWSPINSTIFACCTSMGKVYVFDLSKDLHSPLCAQQVIEKGQLTKIAFNSSGNIIIVGDDHGWIRSFKLSPNLRIQPNTDSSAGGAKKEYQVPLDFEDAENLEKEPEEGEEGSNSQEELLLKKQIGQMEEVFAFAEKTSAILLKPSKTTTN
ncbi:hypothetical protein PCE1_000931 [Barthelona sp. PCE]